MKISVPFIYEAMIVKPRCRRPSLAIIKDSIDIEIKEVSGKDLPVAFRIGETEIRWDGNRLWDYDYATASRTVPEKVLADTVKQNTESGGANYPYSCSGARAPFHNFWHHTEDCMSRRHNTRLHGMRHSLNENGVVNKDNFVYREWLDDNKDAVIAHAKKIAANRLILDGFMYRPVGEPRYVICTFGLGNNHGGTGMFIDQSYNNNIPNSSYFTALEYDGACASADSVASGRGDTKSIPVRPNCGHRIEVLIPEAVKLEPSKEHGQGCDFINRIESGIREAGALGGLLEISKELCKRE